MTQMVLIDENAKPCHDCGQMMTRTGVDLMDEKRWWFCPDHGYDFSESWSVEEKEEWESTKFTPKPKGDLGQG